MQGGEKRRRKTEKRISCISLFFLNKQHSRVKKKNWERGDAPERKYKKLGYWISSVGQRDKYLHCQVEVIEKLKFVLKCQQELQSLERDIITACLGGSLFWGFFLLKSTACTTRTVNNPVISACLPTNVTLCTSGTCAWERGLLSVIQSFQILYTAHDGEGCLREWSGGCKYFHLKRRYVFSCRYKSDSSFLARVLIVDIL